MPDPGKGQGAGTFQPCAKLGSTSCVSQLQPNQHSRQITSPKTRPSARSVSALLQLGQPLDLPLSPGDSFLGSLAPLDVVVVGGLTTPRVSALHHLLVPPYRSSNSVVRHQKESPSRAGPTVPALDRASIMGSSPPSPPRTSDVSIRPSKPVRVPSRTGRTTQATPNGSTRKGQIADPGFLFVDLVDISHRDRRELRSHVMKRVVHQKKRKKDVVPHTEAQLLPKEDAQAVEAPKVDKYLPAGRVDPFNCLALSMDSSMNHLFDYYATVLGPLHYPPPRVVGRNPMTLTWVTSALRDDALLHSTLCSSGGFLHGNANLPSRDLQLLADYYLHKAQTIRLINERVGGADLMLATSDETLGAIALLVTGQTVHGDFNEMMVHMRGMAKLVELRGGLDALGMGGLLAGELIWCDNVSSFIIGTRPLFNLPPGILSTLTTFIDPEVNQLFDAPPLSPKESLLYHHDLPSFLPENLIVVMRELNTMVTVLNTVPSLTEVDMLVFDRKRAILQNSLANLQSYLTSSPRECTAAACLLATIVYSILALWGFRPPSEAYNSISYRFRPILVRTNLEDHWGEWWELLLWVLFVGSCCSLGTGEKYWFHKRIQLLCDDKGLENWSDIQRALRRLPAQTLVLAGFELMWIQTRASESTAKEEDKLTPESLV
ncbi:hypothetical protein F5884DRAFT_898448 [Xylogone sp. PMI_703]|nr:hypothetical protein F5884DRAFT_898448 [Xylogone sp. PMI_703]